MRLLIVIILVSWMAPGCNTREGLPSGILKKEKMQAVFWDVIQAESYTTLFIKKDSLKNTNLENAKLQQHIFAIHNISKEIFYNSYDYYAAHIELMRTLLDSITARGEREKYKILYTNVVGPARISLMPLPSLPPPKPIPMPIPTLSDLPPAQSPESIQKPVFTKKPKPIP